MSEERKELNRGDSVDRRSSKKSKTMYGSIKAFRADKHNILHQDLLQRTEDEDSSDTGMAVRFSPDVNATYFRDGHRHIDFVIVYEETSGHSNKKKPHEKRADKQDKFRQRFMANLKKAGLDMEEEVVESNKRMLYFIKLHAPWSVLCHFAEELNLRAPLQAHPNPSNNWSEWLLKKARLPNLMYREVPNKPLDFYTCPFRKSKIDRFLGSNNRDTYFTSTQRSRIVYEILATAPFGKKKKGEIGIETLVEQGTYNSAFPLHDGPYEVSASCASNPQMMNPRQVLYEYWAKWGQWNKYQPLDHIREYFGEKTAIYFAWLGFYTGWLLPAAVVGLLVFLYGVVTLHFNNPADEVCRSGTEFEMCPLCDNCGPWYLSEICVYAKIAYLFDHPGTVFYAIFVSFWAVTFLEYWKRKSASLAHHWDCMDFEEEEERPRPEFAARAPFLERNPITGVREPSFPKGLRTKRIAAGIGIILVMMSLVMVFIVAVIIYRLVVSVPLFRDRTLDRYQAQAIANISGAVVNLIFIMALGRVYEKLAFRLTSWEMHRTQTEFEDNLTFKVFIFQFVNFYSSIFYIGFFKGRFVGYPGNYHEIFKLRNEDCSAGGCLIELAQQLAVIMIGKQMINNAQEILIPKLKGWWHKRKLAYWWRQDKVKLGKKRKARWEEDYQLIDNEGLFQEYLEMVLQFGFITIFVAAFPLAPLFALLNNWVEIRLDAQKFVCETRRTVAERAQNIGIWFNILSLLAHIAVISNAFLIAFTSEFLPKLLYQYEKNWNLDGYFNFSLAYAPDNITNVTAKCRYRGLRDNEGNFTPFYWKLLAIRFAFVIIFEHVVFGVCRIIDVLVPDVAESLELKIKRERYLAKQALQDSDDFLKVAQQRESGRELLPNGRMSLDLTSGLDELWNDGDEPPKKEVGDVTLQVPSTSGTTLSPLKPISMISSPIRPRVSSPLQPSTSMASAASSSTINPPSRTTSPTNENDG